MPGELSASLCYKATHLSSPKAFTIETSEEGDHIPYGRCCKDSVALSGGTNCARWLQPREISVVGIPSRLVLFISYVKGTRSPADYSWSKASGARRAFAEETEEAFRQCFWRRCAFGAAMMILPLSPFMLFRCPYYPTCYHF